LLENFFCSVDDNPCHPPPVSIPSLHSPSSSHSKINRNPKTKFAPHNNSDDDDDDEEEVTPSPKMFKISLTRQKASSVAIFVSFQFFSLINRKKARFVLPNCELSIFLSHSQKYKELWLKIVSFNLSLSLSLSHTHTHTHEKKKSLFAKL
jgi:hypothetical protein